MEHGQFTAYVELEYSPATRVGNEQTVVIAADLGRTVQITVKVFYESANRIGPVGLSLKGIQDSELAALTDLKYVPTGGPVKAALTLAHRCAIEVAGRVLNEIAPGKFSIPRPVEHVQQHLFSSDYFEDCAAAHTHLTFTVEIAAI